MSEYIVLFQKNYVIKKWSFVLTYYLKFNFNVVFKYAPKYFIFDN